VTDTDLITAGGSTEQVEPPNTVNSDISTPAVADAPGAAPAADPTPPADGPSGNRSGSLSTLVLPELRALANEVGVKGTSGMRKSELIAAIRERRGEANGRAPDAPSAGASDRGSDGGSTPADTATDTATGEGTDELVAAIAKHRSWAAESGERETRRRAAARERERKCV